MLYCEYKVNIEIFKIMNTKLAILWNPDIKTKVNKDVIFNKITIVANNKIEINKQMVSM